MRMPAGRECATPTSGTCCMAKHKRHKSRLGPPHTCPPSRGDAPVPENDTLHTSGVARPNVLIWCVTVPLLGPVVMLALMPAAVAVWLPIVKKGGHVTAQPYVHVGLLQLALPVNCAVSPAVTL